MKTFMKFIIGLFVLSIGYLALSDVSAMCSTLDPYNGTNCDDHQVCTLPSGCNCTRVDVSRPIANGEECLVNNYIASIGDFDITPHALSGSVVNYKMTIVNRQGDKKISIEYTNDQNHKLVLKNINGVNSLLPISNLAPYPVFSIASGETKTISIDFEAYTTDWALDPLDVTMKTFLGKNSEVVILKHTLTTNPIGELVIEKTFTGTSPSFSGDDIYSQIKITNIGSITMTGITFSDAFPFDLLNEPTVSFDGIEFGYNTTQLPNILIRSGSYLDIAPGQTITVLSQSTLKDTFTPGTIYTNTASVSTTQTQVDTTNDSATATGVVVSYIDLLMDQAVILGASPQATGDSVSYQLTYTNVGNDIVTGAQITYSINGTNVDNTILNLADIAAGESTTISLTGIVDNDYPINTEICLVAKIESSLENGPTDNNETTVCHIVEFDGTYVDMIVNNITNSALENALYGAIDQNTLIKAVSGDTIRFTIYYGNDGNVPANDVLLSLAGLEGATLTTSFVGEVGVLAQDQAGVIVIDAIVGPQNYISFSPVVTLTYLSEGVLRNKVDTLTIQEPLMCGDGMVTQTEQCDSGRNGILPNGDPIPEGQACEEQQGICTLVTHQIINNACIQYQYNNPVTGFGTGESCSTAVMDLATPTCNTLTQTSTTENGTNTEVQFTCAAQDASASTAITINCGNGEVVYGYGSSVNGTCTYDAGFDGTATCLVANEVLATNSCTSRVGVGLDSCDVVTLDGDMIILDEDGDGYMPVVCEDENGDEIRNADVDCGNGGDYDDGICEYNNIDEDDIPDLITISCETSAVSCETEILMDEGIFGYCGDGDREGYEQCDDGNNRSGDGCSSRCEREDIDYTPPACFSINNANLSVQEGEVLPFRWNLELKNTELDASPDNRCTPGDINKETMECDFIFYNGKNTQADRDSAEKITRDCYNTNGRSDYSTLFDRFKNSTLYPSQTRAFGRFGFDISPDFTNGVYGEYKLSLDEVRYEFCNEDREREEGNPVGRICEVNFAVTRPYLAQKSVFGLTPQATDIDLDDYYDINGTELIDNTDLNDIMNINASDYDGGQEVKEMMNDVIEKYSKLSVEITKSALGNMKGLDDVKTIKKVPNKQIYILDGVGKITLGGSFDAPVTFITKGLDVHIEGDLTTNSMFLVQDGTIYFDEPTEKRCEDTQKVQGIFVTDEGFDSSSDLTNDNEDNTRCQYGGLHVKGILIGDGLDTLVKARRSQLNTRFYRLGDNENRIEAQLRNKIFNGAAVLIEYSPGLRSDLPPAADEFTQTLEIYKQ